jgi:hypothetical protein
LKGSAVGSRLALEEEERPDVLSTGQAGPSGYFATTFVAIIFPAEVS